MTTTLDKLVFVGFNSRIAALERETGEICWSWKASKGSGYVSLLVDGDSIFASVSGYTYCLDAATGTERWMNPMTGFGFGVTNLATVRGHSGHAPLAESQREQSDTTTPGVFTAPPG